MGESVVKGYIVDIPGTIDKQKLTIRDLRNNMLIDIRIKIRHIRRPLHIPLLTLILNKTAHIPHIRILHLPLLLLQKPVHLISNKNNNNKHPPKHKSQKSLHNLLRIRLLIETGQKDNLR